MNEATILIVDDCIEEIRILVSILRSEGYRIILANSGRDGIVRAAYFKPNLILLDVTMPIMDGFAVCRRLKADQQTADIPVVFLTGAHDIEDRLEGLQLGAVDYISKPAVAEEVVLRVRVHTHKPPPHTSHTTPRTPLQALLNQSGEPVDPAAMPSGRWTDEMLVKVACSLLDNCLDSYPGTDRLAQMVGTHRRRLTQAFYHQYQMTVAEWHRERRLQQAAHLLVATSLSLQAIADDLGYSSPSHFSTAFKERFSVTPRVYRNQQNSAHMKDCARFLKV